LISISLKPTATSQPCLYPSTFHCPVASRRTLRINSKIFRLRQTSADGDFKSLAPGSFETQLELMDARGRASYTINSVKKTIQRRLGDKEVKILALESQITDVSQENSG